MPQIKPPPGYTAVDDDDNTITPPSGYSLVSPDAKTTTTPDDSLIPSRKAASFSEAEANKPYTEQPSYLNALSTPLYFGAGAEKAFGLDPMNPLAPITDPLMGKGTGKGMGLLGRYISPFYEAGKAYLTGNVSEGNKVLSGLVTTPYNAAKASQASLEKGDLPSFAENAGEAYTTARPIAEAGLKGSTALLGGKGPVEAGTDLAKRGAAGTANAIEQRVIRPTAPSWKQAAPPRDPVSGLPTEHPARTITNNVFKYDLGGTAEETLAKSHEALAKRYDAMDEMLQSNPAGTINIPGLINSAMMKFDPMQSDRHTDMAWNDWMDKAQRLEDGGMTQNGEASLTTTNKFKQRVGDEGNWAFGADSSETRGRTAVANYLYPILRQAIEDKAGQAGPAIHDLNQQIGDILPVRDSAMRRVPVEIRNEALSLSEQLLLGGALTGHPAALAAIGVRRALRSGTIANKLAQIGGVRGTARIPQPGDYPQVTAQDTTNRDPLTGEVLPGFTPSGTGGAPTTAYPTPRPAGSPMKRLMPAGSSTEVNDQLSAQERLKRAQFAGRQVGPSAQRTLGPQPGSGQGERVSGAPAQAINLPAAMPTETPVETPEQAATRIGEEKQTPSEHLIAIEMAKQFPNLPSDTLNKLAKIAERQTIAKAAKEFGEAADRPGGLHNLETGTSKVHLTQDGQNMAAQDAQKTGGVDNLYHSDLERTREHAGIVGQAAGVTPQARPEWGPWSSGTEGMDRDAGAVVQKRLAANPDQVPAANPEGTRPTESANQFLQRVDHEKQNIQGLDQSKKNLIVTNSSFMKGLDSSLRNGSANINDVVDGKLPDGKPFYRVGDKSLEPAEAMDKPGTYMVEHGETTNGPPVARNEPSPEDLAAATKEMERRQAMRQPAVQGPEKPLTPGKVIEIKPGDMVKPPAKTARDWAGRLSRQFPDASPKTIERMAQAAVESETKPRPDEAKSQRVADFYDQMKSDPNNPEVKKAYDQMNKEVEQQYQDLLRQGYKIDFTDDPKSYEDLDALKKDVNENKHITVWTGEPPAHGLMSPEQNAKFRAVHDIIGHVQGDNTFGHTGEEGAYDKHKQMFSPEAQKAMATETRGQNATLHFSKELNNPPETRYNEKTDLGLKFPEQKAGILPYDLRTTRPEDSEGLGLANKEPGGAEAAPASAAPTKMFETRTTPRGTKVWMNDEGMQFMKDAGLSSKNATATTLFKQSVDGIINYRNAGLSPNTGRQLAALQDALRQAQQAGATDVQLIPRPGTNVSITGKSLKMTPEYVKELLRHEGNHVQVLRDNGLDLNKLRDDTMQTGDGKNSGDRALAALSSLGYREDDLPIELLAHLVAGQNYKLGLTPDEHIALTKKVADGIVNQLGSARTVDILSQSHPRLKGVIDEIRNKASEGAEPGPGGLGSQSDEVPGASALPGAGRSRSVPEGSLANISDAERQQLSISKRSDAGVEKDAADLWGDITKQGRKQDLIAAAERGSVAKYWYENGKAAFDKRFGNDSKLMAKLTASLSPSADPEGNLRMAINTFRQWEKAGRPTDQTGVDKVLNKVAEIGGKAYPSRYNNARKVLMGADDINNVDLSGRGPKTRSFWRNLDGQYEYGTLDRHMATLAGVAKQVFASKSGYLGGQRLWQDAAKDMGWTTAQVQASDWAFIKPVKEMIQNGTPAEEALKNVSPEAIKNVQEFANLMANSPKIRKVLDALYRQQGTSLDEHESQFGKTAVKFGRPGKPTTEFTPGFAERLQKTVEAEQAAERGEAGKEELPDWVTSLENKEPTKSWSERAADKGYGTLTEPAKMRLKGFIDEDGNGLSIAGGHHEDVLKKMGHPVEFGKPDDPNEASYVDYDSAIGKALRDSNTIRTQVNPMGRVPNVSLHFGQAPNMTQFDAVKSLLEAPQNKNNDIYYRMEHPEFPDKPFEGAVDNPKALYEKLNKTYKMGLTPRDMSYFLGKKRQEVNT